MFTTRYPAMPQPDLGDLWIKHQRKISKTTVSYACVHCLDRRIFPSDEELWTHAKTGYRNKFPTDENEYTRFRKEYEEESLQRRSTKEDSLEPLLIVDGRAQAEPDDKPRKRVAIGDRILAGSSSLAGVEDNSDSSPHPPLQRRKARPKSTPQFDAETRRQHISRKQLWNPDQDTPIPRASFDPSNITSIHAQKSRAPGSQTKSKTPFYSQEHMRTSATTLSTKNKDEHCDIVREPETRPISQEQLVAEVKGIYAGLVMAEAKCVEVDNRQDTLAQAEELRTNSSIEQWQALSLHKTLLPSVTTSV